MSKKTGRPSAYKTAYVGQASKLCALGATDVELADFFEVHVATLNRWKHQYPEFCASIKTGKAELDERVERSLYHKAVGYSYGAIHFSSYQGGVTETPYREHVPPDTTAMIFWLKNRRPETWRDVQKHEHEHAGKIEVTSARERISGRIAQLAARSGAHCHPEGVDGG